MNFQNTSSSTNEGNINTNHNQHKNKRQIVESNINYHSNLDAKEIIKLLDFCYDSKTNTININLVQNKNFELLIELVNKIVDVSYIFSNKSDVSRCIIRICVSKNIHVSGTGLLELINLENYGFIRSEAYGYSQSNDDVFVPAYWIKKYGLRYADEITFLITTDSDSIDKRVSIDDVIKINGISIQDPILKKRRIFAELIPIYPNKKIVLAKKEYKDDLALRIIDLFIPIGYGQRMLTISPPKSGKTTIYQKIASSIAQDSSIKVILLMVDERPEEVTDLKHNIKNFYKCFHSDFNETSNRHTYISELCIEHAKRMCELGHTVFVFIDSLTRLARAYNCTNNNSNKVMSGGIDPIALQKAKKIFGTAINTSNGSIGMMATCLYNTGSKMDEVIYEEFKGTSNSDLLLDRNIAERGIFPAFDIIRSGTRKHELLLSNEYIKVINKFRLLLSRTKIAAIDVILEKMKKSNNNDLFIESLDNELK
ncbi:transcription termination factor Rho [uncultured bacterium]|nr:transcription termination factor Rho [uncultured bacterium]